MAITYYLHVGLLIFLILDFFVSFFFVAFISFFV